MKKRPLPREYLLKPIHFTRSKSFPSSSFFYFFYPLFFKRVPSALQTSRQNPCGCTRAAKFFFHMLRGQNLCGRDPRAIGEHPVGGQKWIERLAPGYFTNMWPENTPRTCIPSPSRPFHPPSLPLFLVRFDTNLRSASCSLRFLEFCRWVLISVEQLINCLCHALKNKKFFVFSCKIE